MKRAFQTDSICQLATASPHPVLVCGDFNSLPSSYTYHRLSESLKDGFKTGGHGYMYTVNITGLWSLHKSRLGE